mmetsp:Transcript_15747/g.40634  ORF Transcript_15747/g.40634 Transcript_15747/m.40634 type:complete len:80 (-) Transcript_15747:6-245(-)
MHDSVVQPVPLLYCAPIDPATAKVATGWPMVRLVGRMMSRDWFTKLRIRTLHQFVPFGAIGECHSPLNHQLHELHVTHA